MSRKECIVRLNREYKKMMKDPVPSISAHPIPNNILEWHYVLVGSPDTVYENGVYHGKVIFPPKYPMEPPSIVMLTPNGRFSPNMKLCLSMTDFHPETWNPAWSVATILTGLLSFMQDDQFTTGSITTSAEHKRVLARASLAYNVKNSTFRKLFPEWVVEEERRRKAAEAKRQQGVTVGKKGEEEEEEGKGGKKGSYVKRRGREEGIYAVISLVTIVIIALGLYGTCISLTNTT